MHWTIFCCDECRKDEVLEHINKDYFKINERFFFFCKECGKGTWHTARKQFIDTRLI